jgi:hypothetical protein
MVEAEQFPENVVWLVPIVSARLTPRARHRIRHGGDGQAHPS